MYGKVIHGCLRSSKVEYQTEEEYIKAGYKPVEFTPRPVPPSGYDYMVGWEEQDNEIVQTWHLVELPDEVDEAEAFDIIFGGAE